MAKQRGKVVEYPWKDPLRFWVWGENPRDGSFCENPPRDSWSSRLLTNQISSSNVNPHSGLRPWLLSRPMEKRGYDKRVDTVIATSLGFEYPRSGVGLVADDETPVKISCLRRVVAIVRRYEPFLHTDR
ncbi:hypothetical protein GX50_06422 [[Emmonsia] crescens]|uniref:Uncharacterized protein n=1 Tax=[Emmonsia] crescens TaxID=73230 RepID=A0A2B7Z352_9EURO|nr:hypothetical protein GX50_06422 [Emmonsia crescens]